MILEAASLLVGLWSYEAFQSQPKLKAPTQSENMEYEFKVDGTARLRWDLLDAGNFCERTGVYLFKDGKLTDEVKALNPQNHASCADDPDMQVGAINEMPARLENGKLILTVNLGEEQIELMFKKAADPAPVP